MLKFMPPGWMTLLISLALAAILGCNAKPFDYQPTAGEMKEGPGVLTGEDGELTIYDSKRGGAFPKESDATAAETSGEKTAQAPAAAAGGSQAKPGEFQEFQEFQQWQQEKEQFHQYQQWKKSTAGSADFKEFQEYQQWKESGKSSADYKEFEEWREFKSYQEWKKSQKK